jgi:membrane-associated phospholipid phosphatase
MLAVIVIVLAVVWAVMASMIAISKNRSGVGWFFAGLCLGVVGVLIVFVAFPLPDPTPQSTLQPEYAAPSIWWK